MSPTRTLQPHVPGRRLFAPAGARRLTALLAALLLSAPAASHAQQAVRVVADAAGSRLQVDGADFMVLGMNWDYFPIGQNYAYNFWGQSDAFIRTALDREMALLKSMGVNTIRQYVGVPPRWVRYIYENYGIYTVLNHAVGRYGVTVGGGFQANTDYSDPRVRAQLTREVTAMVEEFRGTPGLLMYLLGNENNYGLEWKSAETENLPVGERNAAKARYLYSLFGEIIREIKTRDPSRPVAMANGDLQYIDIIAAETKGLDVFGTNVYRGISFGNLFAEVRDKLGLPVMFTEFGADAYNAKERREDQLTQARYLLGQWQEIYAQSAGKGGVGNAIGGMTFQWSDGWWKVGQETNLDVQDTDAGWSNQAYAEDYMPDDNNMNEEWWGVMAKGPTDATGHFQLYPRAAYYALQRAYTLAPYAPGTDTTAIRAHFSAIAPAAMELLANGDRAARGAEIGDRYRIAGMRLDLSTFSTGGSNISTPGEGAAASPTARPAFRGFDHLESYFVDVEARPASNVTAMVSFNVTGNIPDNPINELFYENRARSRTLLTDGGPAVTTEGLERLRVYRASMRWDERNFRLDGFYRTGHYHWGYEGDFFGMYREANYGANIDIYGGEAPLGMEFTGKRALSGLKLAFGPELWWGANPAILAKYRKQLGRFTVTGVYQEDLQQRGATASSFAIPQPQVRATTMHIATTVGPAGVELGGIWGGNTRVGRPFQIADGEPGNYRVLQDRVKDSDAFGAKAKVTVSSGAWNWYAQGAAMGLVADGGQTSTMTFTGWGLKDSGMGNQWNALSGLTYTRGNWQIAPNFLWQKPIVGPVPSDVPVPGRPRNILDDPFSVRWNRETVAGELLLTFDPTPASYMHQWDNDTREDARLAGTIGFTYRHLPTTQDAAIGILADGRTFFAFPGAAPAQDLWEVRSRVVSRLTPDVRLIANLFGGTAQANGDSDRLLQRYGGDLRLVRGQIKLAASAKFNDWGPFDYHRDFNLTFPEQYMADVSYVLGIPNWTDAPATRFGVRGTWRSLDRFSPRYCPAETADALGTLTCDPMAPGARGSEWEVRTYLTVGW
jgi:beta-galactosidase